MKRRIACNIRTIGNMLVAYANRIDGTHTIIMSDFSECLKIDETKRKEQVKQIESDKNFETIRELGRIARQQRKLETA
jgi:hypothetical protein